MKEIVYDGGRLGGIKIGVSAAASWAWGTSLVLGQQICQQRGLGAFAIWAVANTMTMVLFAVLMNRGVIKPTVFDNPIIKTVAIIIQMFCLIVNLNAIYQTVFPFLDNGLETYAITSAVGIAFTMAMFKHGLPSSIKADLVKWFIVMVSICLIVALGVVQGAPTRTFPVSGGSDLMWAVWSAAILLSGLIGDVQHWQRALADKTKRCYYNGAIFFGIYMLGVLAMAYFEFSPAMNVLLLIACLGVTVSTINSIAVAMHEVVDKRVGTAITVFICLAWGIGINIGLIELWSNFGIVRVCFAITIVVSSMVISEVVRNANMKKSAEH